MATSGSSELSTLSYVSSQDRNHLKDVRDHGALLGDCKLYIRVKCPNIFLDIAYKTLVLKDITRFSPI